MKSMALLLAIIALLSLWGLSPFQGEEISRLQPVELLVVAPAEGGVSLHTEGGLASWGQDFADAVETLKASAKGKLLLSTVEHVVLTGQPASAQEILACGLRPGTGVYSAPVVEDPDALSAYLRNKKSPVTLGLWQEESVLPPALVTGQTGLYLP